jgi:lysophospholipase L1-like esterase
MVANYMRWVAGDTIVAWGDSITAGSLGNGNGGATPPAAGQQQTQGMNFAALGATLTDRVRFIHNAGVPGETSTAIKDRWTRDVKPYKSYFVMLMAGTNDISTSSGITQATTKANILSMISLIVADGRVPILCTIPPKTLSSTVTDTERDRVLDLNIWLRGIAGSSGFPLFDAHRILTDAETESFKSQYALSLGGATGGTLTLTVTTRGTFPPTGLAVSATTSTITPSTSAATLATILSTACGSTNEFVVAGASGEFTFKVKNGAAVEIVKATDSLTGKTGTSSVSRSLYYSHDGVHPYGDGVLALGVGFAELMNELVPSPPKWRTVISDNNTGTPSVSDSVNLIRNGCFTYDASADGRPDIWTLNTGTFNYSLITPATEDALAGKWLRGVGTSASFAYFASQALRAGTYAAGDRIAFLGRIRVTGATPSATMPWSADARKYTVGLEVTSSTNRFRAIDDWHWDFGDGYFYVEAVLPTGVGTINAIIGSTGVGVTIDVGECTVLNLTALGLDAMEPLFREGADVTFTNATLFDSADLGTELDPFYIEAVGPGGTARVLPYDGTDESDAVTIPVPDNGRHPLRVKAIYESFIQKINCLR